MRVAGGVGEQPPGHTGNLPGPRGLGDAPHPPRPRVVPLRDEEHSGAAGSRATLWFL
jgi:hypothetical protein